MKTVLLYFIFTNDDNNVRMKACENGIKDYKEVQSARRDVFKPYHLSFSIAIAWEGQERTVTC